MSVQSGSATGTGTWADLLAELEQVVGERERLVEQGRLEELRVLPAPVVASGLPPELVERARALQTRMAALSERVVAAMGTTRRDLELVAAERAGRPERSDRHDRGVRRQWQPSYVDARA